MSDRDPYEWTTSYVLEHTIPQTAEEENAIREYFEVAKLCSALGTIRSDLCDRKEYEKLDEIDDKMTECYRRMSALEDSDPIKKILENEYNRRAEETRRQYMEEELAKMERLSAEYNEKRQQARAARQQRLLNEEVQESESTKTTEAPSNSIKDKLVGTFGCFGLVILYAARCLICALPFVMIECNFFASLALIALNMFVPVTSVVFWLWGLVCAIQGYQDIVAILYYIAFAVIWLPFYISIIASLLKKNR